MSIVECVSVFKPDTKTLLVRAWLQDDDLNTIVDPIDVARCRCFVRDEAGVELFRAVGSADPAGTEYVSFEIQDIQMSIDHSYVMEVTIKKSLPGSSWGQFALGTVG